MSSGYETCIDVIVYCCRFGKRPARAEEAFCGGFRGPFRRDEEAPAGLFGQRLAAQRQGRERSDVHDGQSRVFQRFHDGDGYRDWREVRGRDHEEHALSELRRSGRR